MSNLRQASAMRSILAGATAGAVEICESIAGALILL